mmetsp:Transcript_8636/g.13691  ORF Transcript_8636/g.13691 Transcript_8636/m.13691 type:complete len:274 (-) Transcript_8636:93-914(-)
MRSALPTSASAATARLPQSPSTVRTRMAVASPRTGNRTICTSVYKSAPTLVMIPPWFIAAASILTYSPPFGVPWPPCSFSRRVAPSETPAGTVTSIRVSSETIPAPRHSSQPMNVDDNRPVPSQPPQTHSRVYVRGIFVPSTASSSVTLRAVRTSLPGASPNCLSLIARFAPNTSESQKPLALSCTPPAERFTLSHGLSRLLLLLPSSAAAAVTAGRGPRRCHAAPLRSCPTWRTVLVAIGICPASIIKCATYSVDWIWKIWGRRRESGRARG